MVLPGKRIREMLAALPLPLSPPGIIGDTFYPSLHILYRHYSMLF